MNILSKISVKNLKLNKKRTISTIIGIILSCSLICAVATLVSSFQETLIQNAINESGYYHLQINGVSDKDIKTLKNNRDIKDVLTFYENGYAKFERGKNEYFPYLKINSMSNSLFNYLKFELKEGRFPKNNKELVISKNAIKYGDENLKLGDKITLDVGQRVSKDGTQLTNKDGYQENETLANTEKVEFTIVGIIERPSQYFELYDDPGFTAITTNSNFGKNNSYIVLKNPKNYEEDICEILGVSDLIDTEKDENLRYKDFSINEELLKWEAFMFSKGTVSTLYSVVGIVIVIIMITSVFCIRNSIAIATTEKLKMYGMLASIGATKKQIKKNVICEALFLGIIGIPLGIICGIFAIFILIHIVNSIAGKYMLPSMNGIVVKVTIFPIILSIILSCLTLYLSSLSSARKASKTSPLDLIRNPEKIKLKSKKLKVSRIISKFFKIGGEIAYKNLKRSKRKYRTTVISITVSIAVFITMSSVLGNIFDLNDDYSYYDYNIKVFTDNEKETDINKIKNLNNIDEYFEVYNSLNSLEIYDMDKIVNPDNVPEDMQYDKEKEEYIPTGKGKHLSLSIIGLDTKTFNKYLKKIKVNQKDVKGKGILFNSYMEYNEEKILKKKIYNYSKNDIIEGKMEDKIKTFEVGAVSNIKPYGYENYNYFGGLLIVNKDDFKDINFSPSFFLIQSNNPEKFEEDYEKLNLNFEVMNYDAMVKEQKAMDLIVKIFLYGFITVIILIGVTNIFNTITSNMELRQKEFAILKSIGMTKKEFNRMINLETIFYSTKSLIYGIILGLLGTLCLNKAFSIKFEFANYIPINPIIISIISVFVLVFIIMKYSINKINKQNIIETIRKENI